MKTIEQALRDWLLNQIDFTSRCQNAPHESTRLMERGEQQGYISTLNKLNEIIDTVEKFKKGDK